MELRHARVLLGLSVAEDAARFWVARNQNLWVKSETMTPTARITRVEERQPRILGSMGAGMKS